MSGGGNLVSLQDARRLLQQQIKQPRPGVLDPYHLSDIRGLVAWIGCNRWQGWAPPRYEADGSSYNFNHPQFGGSIVIEFVARMLAEVAQSPEGVDVSSREVKKCLLQIDAAAGYLIAEGY